MSALQRLEDPGAIGDLKPAAGGVGDDVLFPLDVRHGDQEVVPDLQMREQLEEVRHKRVRRSKSRHPAESAAVVGVDVDVSETSRRATQSGSQQR